MKLLAISQLIFLLVAPVCCSHQRCSKVALHAWCSSNYTRQMASVYYECERDFDFHERRCRVDDRGNFCGSFVDELDTIEKAKSLCLNKTSCDRSCYEQLHKLKKELGCCINEMLNGTRGPTPHRELFNYSLWVNCSLTVPPLQGCSQSTRLTRFPKPEVTKQCSFHEFFQKRYQAQCSNSTMAALARDYDGHDCHQVSKDLYDTCSVTEEGVWCIEKFLKNLTSIIKLFRSARQFCNGVGGCNEGCQEALLGIKTNLGCCINNMFNNSFVQLVYTETSFNSVLAHYEVWKSCGVTHPCSCTVKTYVAGAASLPQGTSMVYLIMCMIAITINALINYNSI